MSVTPGGGGSTTTISATLAGNASGTPQSGRLSLSFPTAKLSAIAGDTATIVFHTDGSLTTAQGKTAITDAIAAAKTIPHVVGAGDPLANKGGQISQSGKVGYVDVQFDQRAWTLPANTAPDFKAAVEKAVDGSGVQVAFTGQVMQAESAGWTISIFPASTWPVEPSSVSSPPPPESELLAASPPRPSP